MIICLSGGMDSVTLLYYVLSIMDKSKVKCLSVFYEQKHQKEIDYAKGITQLLDIEHKIADIGLVADLFSRSALVGSSEVPDGHYTDEVMKETVVPNRNMIMLSLAAAWAINDGLNTVGYAAHAGDHTIYPDCRPEFIEHMADTFKYVHFEPVQLFAPFARLSKAEIVKLGSELKVPYQNTWSCYKGGEYHCGRCGTCVERKEAFKLAEVDDPTKYEEN